MINPRGSTVSRSAVESSRVAAALPTVHHHLTRLSRSEQIALQCCAVFASGEPVRTGAVSHEMSRGATDTPTLQQLSEGRRDNKQPQQSTLLPARRR